MKQIRYFVTVVFSIFCAALFFSCADANGLHDQNALVVTFKVVNFGSGVNGSFAIAGDFNGDETWEVDNSAAVISLKGGDGVASQTYPVTSTWIKFTVCAAGDSAWSRAAWFPAVKGNAAEGDNYWNFYIGDLDLSAGEATIVIDGSKSGLDSMVYVE